MSLAVTLSFGGVNFSLTPNSNIDHVYDDGTLSTSPVVFIKKSTSPDSQTECSASASSCLVAELMGFSGKLCIYLSNSDTKNNDHDYESHISPNTESLNDVERNKNGDGLPQHDEGAPGDNLRRDDEQDCIPYRQPLMRATEKVVLVETDAQASSHTENHPDNKTLLSEKDKMFVSPHTDESNLHDNSVFFDANKTSHDDTDKRDEGTLENNREELDLQLTNSQSFESSSNMNAADDSSAITGEADGASYPLGRNVAYSFLATSPLHTACARPDVKLEELRLIVESVPESVRTNNSAGQLPLHILAQNDALLATREGREKAKNVAKMFFDIYPQSIVTKDSEGRIPFTTIIRRWIETVHLSADATVQWASSTSGLTRFRHFAMTGNNARSSFDSEQIDDAVDEPGSPTGRDFDRTLPLVEITPMVLWSFSMLSTALDYMGGPLSSEAGDRKLKLRERAILAESVASIPHLIKTILLIDDNEARKYILDMSIFRRALLCKVSVGKWLVTMLKSAGLPSQRAVDYFVLVSRTTVVDFIGAGRTPLSEDYESFHGERDAVFNAVQRYDSILPSLVALSSKEIERASTTRIVWWMLNDSISRPFVIGIVLIDFILHLTLMIVFEKNVGDVARAIQTGSSTSNLFTEHVPLVLIMLIGMHFFLRKLSEAVSLLMISWKVFNSYFWNFWNLLDYTSIILAVVASWMLRNPADVPDHSIFFSITVALLWLKLLGFLKAVNMHLATSILAIVQIIKDVRWFLVIVTIAILMFADVIRITMTLGYDDFCVSDDEESGAREDFCRVSPVWSYIRVYSLLLGDFQLDDFAQRADITIFFILFTILGVIIMLNILIAVVCDSYEKSRIRSNSLFGRARVGFVVEHISLETFFRPNKRDARERLSIRNVQNLAWIAGRFLRWCILMSLLGTAVATDMVLVSFVVAGVNRQYSYNTPFVSVIAVILTVLINVALVVVMKFIFHGFARNCGYDHGGSERGIHVCRGLSIVFMLLNKFVNFTVNLISEKVFGIRRKVTDSKEKIGDEEDWNGIIGCIERHTTAIVSEAEHNVSAAVKASEKRIKEYESSLRMELKEDMKKILEAVAKCP